MQGLICQLSSQVLFELLDANDLYGHVFDIFDNSSTIAPYVEPNTLFNLVPPERQSFNKPIKWDAINCAPSWIVMEQKESRRERRRQKN
jgi:hypothetical protein